MNDVVWTRLRTSFWRHGRRATALTISMSGHFDPLSRCEDDVRTLAAIHRRLAYRCWRLMVLLRPGMVVREIG